MPRRGLRRASVLSQKCVSRCVRSFAVLNRRLLPLERRGVRVVALNEQLDLRLELPGAVKRVVPDGTLGDQCEPTLDLISQALPMARSSPDFRAMSRSGVAINCSRAIFAGHGGAG